MFFFSQTLKYSSIVSETQVFSVKALIRESDKRLEFQQKVLIVMTKNTTQKLCQTSLRLSIQWNTNQRQIKSRSKRSPFRQTLETRLLPILLLLRLQEKNSTSGLAFIRLLLIISIPNCILIALEIHCRNGN
jgi:hypothetical protein